MMDITPVITFSPIGELIRLVVLKHLAVKGEAAVDEINNIAKKVVEAVGIKYDWTVWPRLFTREIVISNGIVRMTEFGRMVLKETEEIVILKLKKYGLDEYVV